MREMYAYPITINGTTYKSARQCCKALDINYVNVQQYSRRKKISMKDAIIQYMHGGARSITVNGVIYSSKKQCCEKLEIKYENAQRYKDYHGITWEETVMHFMTKKQN